MSYTTRRIRYNRGMQTDLHLYADAALISIGLLWLGGAVTTKRTERVETPGSHVRHILLAVGAFSLIFRPTGFARGRSQWAER